MANLRVIAEIKPAGDFPVVDAPNVSVTGGKRLDVALSEAAAEVAKKANKSEVDTALASKANKSEVDAALAGKANKSEVDAAIENKADKSAFEAINASVSVNTSNIQGLSTESTVLSARMDEFTKLEEGSTTGDAELADGRVGADGKTYDNIGGAIRGQVTDLKSDLVNLKIGEIHPQSKDFRIGYYENGEFKSFETRRITVDVGYITKGTEIYIDSNNQYYMMVIYEDTPKSGVKILQSTDWSDIGKVNVKHSGYLVISVANAKTYNASTDIKPSDYAMDIIVKIPTGLYSSLAETVTNIKRYSIGEKLEVSHFVQGGYENGSIYYSNVRITGIVSVSKNDVIEINNTNGQYISIVNTGSDGEQELLLDWNAYSKTILFNVKFDGIVAISVATAPTHNMSEPLTPNDYKCDVSIINNNNNNSNKKKIDFILNGEKIESFSQYGIEQGKINTNATRRIHFIVGYCEKDTSFELLGDNKYLCVDVYPNTIDSSTQSAIDSSGWVSSNTPFKTRKSGYACILVANGARYGSSTDIIPSDFTGYVMHKSYLDGKLSVNDLMTNAFVSTYNSIGSVEEHVKNYAKLFKNIGKGDGFLFFTDLHIIYKDGWEDRLKECLAYIEQIANTTPISFVLNGGDWLGSYDGQDRALYMLSRIAGTMRAKFGERHALILGNHDTNYQGGITQEDGDNHIENGRLSQEAIDNTYSSMRRKSYYRYEAPTFALYIFDTGIEISALATDYYRNQVKWFAEALKTEKMEHIVIGMHIIYNGQNLLDMANELTKCAKAYNERGSYSYGGETYNYANMMNKVAFAIGGHNHADSNGVINSIPYVLTVNASPYGSYSTLPFDLCAVDWDNSKLYMYRCELGKDGTTREIDIISN